MLRKVLDTDKNSLVLYLSSKLNISIASATITANKIIKHSSISFLKEEKDLSGVCWIESRMINNIKHKFIEIVCNNWRLAEDFLQCLRWNLNGTYYFLIPRHDFLNRTFNKNGIKFIKIEGENHLYSYKFEKREFRSFKSEDLIED